MIGTTRMRTRDWADTYLFLRKIHAIKTRGKKISKSRTACARNGFNRWIRYNIHCVGTSIYFYYKWVLHTDVIIVIMPSEDEYSRCRYFPWEFTELFPDRKSKTVGGLSGSGFFFICLGLFMFISIGIIMMVAFRGLICMKPTESNHRFPVREH